MEYIEEFILKLINCNQENYIEKINKTLQQFNSNLNIDTASFYEEDYTNCFLYTFILGMFIHMIIFITRMKSIIQEKQQENEDEQDSMSISSIECNYDENSNYNLDENDYADNYELDYDLMSSLILPLPNMEDLMRKSDIILLDMDETYKHSKNKKLYPPI